MAVATAWMSVAAACAGGDSAGSTPAANGGQGGGNRGSASGGQAGEQASGSGSGGSANGGGGTGNGGNATSGSGGAEATGGAGGGASGGASGSGGTSGSGGAGSGDGGPADTTSTETAPPTGVQKIMVMGSSNEVRTCWRAFLWQKLRMAGVTNFDFVGSMKDGPDCGVAGYDKDDESRSGTIVTDITAAQYKMRFSANVPDIVLVHFGGADILQGIAPEKVIPGYTLMVEQARMLNPRIRFLVAEHTPMTPANCPKCPMTVPELNAATVAWTKQISTPTSPVTSVDLFNGIDAATDTSDRVHLNDAGSQKVADKWVAALLPIFKP
jgi:hypothetical protein